MVPDKFHHSSMAPKTVVLDGLIGAGKTTLIGLYKDHLESKGLKVSIVKEPIDEWIETGILDKFYQDQDRWSYSFQTKVFCDKIKRFNSAYRSALDDNTDILIMERFVTSDTFFAKVLHDSGSLSEMEWNMYLDWCHCWKDLLDFEPEHFILLNPRPDLCMNRIQIRARESESEISEDYQFNLLDKHLEFYRDDPVKRKIFSCDLDFVNDQDNQKIVFQILDEMTGANE